ncbi:short-chain dehydrogenase [Pyrenophora seminiperda CCB06]|uniref:3beta-hydroxysteroid 3-dehydrogenase n=1 Tax=Pyrenophora seminiperda CCB06 TaxID=1302712 RepID=A0A3M7M0H2_9PLEO|nr:short-chain dehydrogenase [Pyrenophora seminiperda CCB06]
MKLFPGSQSRSFMPPGMGRGSGRRLEGEQLQRLIDLLEAGHNNSSIHRDTGISRNTIAKIRMYLKQWGVPYPPPCVRLGRPATLSPSQMEGLRKFIKENPNAQLKDIRNWLLREYDVVTSLSTVSRALTKLNCPRARPHGNRKEPSDPVGIVTLRSQYIPDDYPWNIFFKVPLPIADQTSTPYNCSIAHCATIVCELMNTVYSVAVQTHTDKASENTKVSLEIREEASNVGKPLPLEWCRNNASPCFRGSWKFWTDMLTQNHRVTYLLTMKISRRINSEERALHHFVVSYFAHPITGTILITGANGSLAIPAVEYLLTAYPHYTLVLTVRNDSVQDKNTAELRRVLAQRQDTTVSVRVLDLASLEEVRNFSNVLLSEIKDKTLPRLSAIICNAFTWNLSDGPKYSTDGYETAMAVNHLAHFSLCLRLLSGMDPIHGRIVFLGSVAHWPEKASLSKGYPTHIPEDLELLVHPQPDKQGEETGKGFQRYGTSKLVTIMVMYELNRRLKAKKDTESIRAVAVDPLDLINSRAFRQPHIPRSLQIMAIVVTWLLPLLGFLVPRLAKVEQAAKPVVEVAVAERFAGQEGYFEGEQKVDSSPDSMEEKVQLALWCKSVEWCGLKEGDSSIEL